MILIRLELESVITISVHDDFGSLHDHSMIDHSMMNHFILIRSGLFNNLEFTGCSNIFFNPMQNFGKSVCKVDVKFIIPFNHVP